MSSVSPNIGQLLPTHISGGVGSSSDSAWDRIFARLRPSLVRLEEMASVLFDRGLTESERQEVPGIVDNLARRLGGLGLGLVAGSVRGIGDLLTSDELGAAEAIALASALDQARTEMARRAMAVQTSPKLGARMVVVSEGGSFADEVLWAGLAQGLDASLAPDSAACKFLDPEVLVLIAGTASPEQLKLSSEDLRLSFADLPLIVVVDEHEELPGGAQLLGVAQRQAAMSVATTILTQREGAAEGVVTESRQRVLHAGARPTMAVFGQGSEWLARELDERGIVATSSPSLSSLIQSVRSGECRAALLLPNRSSDSGNGSDTHRSSTQGCVKQDVDQIRTACLLRTDPDLRDAVIFIIDDNMNQVRRHEALRKGVDQYFGPDFAIDDLAVRAKAMLLRQQSHGSSAATSTGLSHHWERASIAIDGLCAAALRQRSVLGFALVRTDADMTERPDFDDGIARLFRSDSIVTRLDAHNLVVVVPGLARQPMMGRMNDLYLQHGLGELGASVACLQLPEEAATLSSALHEAALLLDEPGLEDGSVVGASAPPAEATRPDVMILDQDETVAAVLVSTLQRRGLTVEYQNDGLQAIEHLRAGELPRVLLVDLNLQDIEGLQFLRLISGEGMMDKMRVIVLASAMDESLLRISFELGIDDFVMKPLSAPLLLRRLQRALGQS